MSFEKLVSSGNLGFYTSCEVTTVYFFNKNDPIPYNYYTIFVFEERGIENKTKYVTSKPVSIKDIRMGIIQYQISVSDAQDAFRNLCNTSPNTACNISDGDLQIGSISLLPKQFILPESTTVPPINKILKNNYRNGSYILEFFDMEKPKIPKETMSLINNKILEYFPIDLAVIDDRIGNIIFQFPLELLVLTHSTNNEETELAYSLHFDERITDISKYTLIAEQSFDDNIAGFSVTPSINSREITIHTGDTGGLNVTKILDAQTNLIIYSSSTSFIKSISTNLHIAAGKRLVRDSMQNMHTHIISFRHDIPVGNFGIEWKDFTRKRQYANNLLKLENQMKFLKYNNQREKALHDIRKIISTTQADHISLWDPFLQANDILDTLYFAKDSNICLKAITSYKKAKLLDIKKFIKIVEKEFPEYANSDFMLKIKERFKSGDGGYGSFKQSQIDALDNSSNHFGINLEFRCQHENHGTSFHDRFLIITNQGNSRVWALGTSVNSLGNDHHIIQEVENPQYIADAFSELWNSINDPSCLIFKKEFI